MWGEEWPGTSMLKVSKFIKFWLSDECIVLLRGPQAGMGSWEELVGGESVE